MKERKQAAEKVIDEVVDELLEDYGHLLAGADRKLARSLLSDVLATHPVTADLLKLIVPAPVVEQSDEVGKDDASSLEEPAARGGRHE